MFTTPQQVTEFITITGQNSNSSIFANEYLFYGFLSRAAKITVFIVDDGIFLDPRMNGKKVIFYFC